MTAIQSVSKGFQIEEPLVFIDWGINEEQLISSLSPTMLNHVTDGYYAMDCISLQGLKHVIGFHLRPAKSGRLSELEFSRREYPDLNESYIEFQEHLEACFGAPHHTRPGGSGFLDCLWIFGRVRLSHMIFDRFGPEERISMECALQ